MNHLDKVIASYQDNSKLFNGMIYELKGYGDNIYSLQRNIFGPCGDKIPHPSIKFSYCDGEVSFIHYADFEHSPLINKVFEDEELSFFEGNFNSLVEDFFHHIDM